MSAPSDSPEQSDPVESSAVADSTAPNASESPDSSALAETSAVDAPDAIAPETAGGTSPDAGYSANNGTTDGTTTDETAADGATVNEDTADRDTASDEDTDGTAPDDPRVNEEYLRRLPELGLTLVGVVHDHPASVHRARAVVRERDPEVVALEVPPVATPLFRTYAEDSQTPPTFGGEMSAAAQAGEECDAEVVGIDGPTREFFARLARNCWDERASPGTLRRVASGVASVTRHALVCRAAAEVAERTSLRVEVDSPVDHDCDRSDSPAVQARDEHQQAQRSQSLLRAFDPPEPVALRDETREECMAAALDELRSRGETVAVVGLDHLDGVVTQLTEE